MCIRDRIESALYSWADPIFEVADIKNIGSGPYGGAITAGLFLKEFVAEDIPWAHLDIAGPAFADAPWGIHPKGGTGFGVRLLLRFIEDFK